MTPMNETIELMLKYANAAGYQDGKNLCRLIENLGDMMIPPAGSERGSNSVFLETMRIVVGKLAMQGATDEGYAHFFDGAVREFFRVDWIKPPMITTQGSICFAHREDSANIACHLLNNFRFFDTMRSVAAGVGKGKPYPVILKWALEDLLETIPMVATKTQRDKSKNLGWVGNALIAIAEDAKREGTCNNRRLFAVSDLARAVGKARSTVSRYLDNDPHSTLARVWERHRRGLGIPKTDMPYDDSIDTLHR